VPLATRATTLKSLMARELIEHRLSPDTRRMRDKARKSGNTGEMMAAYTVVGTEWLTWGEVRITSSGKSELIKWFTT
jgi:hypothetical protein